MNLQDIFDAMLDWVRVVDKENRILYVNKAMHEGLGMEITEGLHCYEMLGFDSPCDNCISRTTVFEGHSHEKEERINGRIYSIKSSPLRNKAGEVVAAVEVLRDITYSLKLQHKITEQNRKLRADLSLAKKLQCSLLPKSIADSRVDFGFIYKPCDSLGGDFLDIFKIDDDHVGIYIADVSGHGVTASMLTVFLRSTFNKSELSPAKALSDLYTAYNRSNFDADLYITVFYVVIDVAHGSVSYANAGHHALPIVYSGTRQFSLFAKGTPISNWVDEARYKEHSLQLEQDDSLLFFTDGLMEVENAEGQPFGETQLHTLITKIHGDASETVQRLEAEVSAYTKGTFSDDVTLAVLQIHPGTQSEVQK